MPTPSKPKRCPCGSGSLYAECCEPLHRGRASGEATAPTAERLMRSRFSAFAVGDADYLLATWHPSERPARLELDPDIQWRRLLILHTTGGGERDDRGTVAFEAHYWDPVDGEWGEQQENSAFIREAGQWYYAGIVAGL